MQNDKSKSEAGSAQPQPFPNPKPGPNPRLFKPIASGHKGWPTSVPTEPPPPPPTPIDPQTALVLGAGASKVAFEVGAVRYLYSHHFPETGAKLPGIIVGTSGGAVNGVKLAEGGSAALDELESLWLTQMKSYPDMFEEQPWLDDLLNMYPQLANTLATYIEGNLIGAGAGVVGALIGGSGTFGIIMAVVSLIFQVWDIFSIEDDINRLKGDINDGMASGSFYDLGPLAGTLAQNVYPTWVAASEIKLRIQVTHLKSGLTWYVNEQAQFIDMPSPDPFLNPVLPAPIGPGEREPINSMSYTIGSAEYGSGYPPLLGAVLASASIPVIFAPVGLNIGEHYINEWFVDGGVRKYLDIRTAVEAGATKVFAVSTETPSPQPDDRTQWSLLGILQRTSDIAPAQMTQDSLFPPGGWSEAVTVIRPLTALSGGTSIDPGPIRIDMAYGFLRAADVVMYGPDQIGRLTAPIPLAATEAIYQNRLSAWQLELDSLLFSGLFPPKPGDISSGSKDYWAYEIWRSAVGQSGSRAQTIDWPWMPNGFPIDSSSFGSAYSEWWQNYYLGYATQAVANLRAAKMAVYQAVVQRVKAGATLPDPYHWGTKPPDPTYPWDDASTWYSSWEAHNFTPPQFSDPWASMVLDSSVPNGTIPGAKKPSLSISVSVSQASQSAATTQVTVSASDAANGITTLQGQVILETGAVEPLGTPFTYTFGSSSPTWIARAIPYPDTAIPASAFGSRYGRR